MKTFVFLLLLFIIDNTSIAQAQTTDLGDWPGPKDSIFKKKYSKKKIKKTPEKIIKRENFPYLALPIAGGSIANSPLSLAFERVRTKACKLFSYNGLDCSLTLGLILEDDKQLLGKFEEVGTFILNYQYDTMEDKSVFQCDLKDSSCQLRAFQVLFGSDANNSKTITANNTYGDIRLNRYVRLFQVAIYSRPTENMTQTEILILKKLVETELGHYISGINIPITKIYFDKQVELIQEKLKKLRLYNGRIDGIIGSLTISAIKEFQLSLRKQPSGNLTIDEYHVLLNPR